MSSLISVIILREMQKTVDELFMLVEFTHCVNKNGIADIDIVPSAWIVYDDNEATCKTPYPNPPYNNHCCKLLHTRVKKRMPPLLHWPKWPITIKGSASTYIFLYTVIRALYIFMCNMVSEYLTYHCRRLC